MERPSADLRVAAVSKVFPTREIETGEPLLIESKATLLATGGCGQVFRTTSNAHINTGDGCAMALRAELPLETAGGPCRGRPVAGACVERRFKP